jgi:hypothetical protein
VHIVPILWALVGAQAALLLGVPQDLGLLVAAAIGGVLLVRAKVPLAASGKTETGMPARHDD